MSDLQTIITFVVFCGVIAAIAFDLIDMAVTAMLGLCVLLVAGIFTGEDVGVVIHSAGGPLALLFGGMVVARTLVPTGIFDHVGTRFLRLTNGSGKRYILGIFILVAPLCAFLPNATTVILVAPIIIRVAIALEVDFVGPMVLTAIISNSAGLLTLVGDPATFLVGSSIGLTFNQYLKRVSIGGLLSLVVLVPLMPLIMKDVWRVRKPIPEILELKPIQKPLLLVCSLVVLAGMVLLFLFGEYLPVRIVPPSVSIIAASLALLIIYGTHVEPVDKVLKDVDWKTLIFLTCLFCLVQALSKTGILSGMSRNLLTWFGTDLPLVGLAMLAFVSLSSSLIANIPVVAAMLLLVKGYLVAAQLVPDYAMGAAFTDWPLATLPVFVAMMFGGTLGGNATLIGASANVVSAGICAAEGKRITFTTFLRYGIPLTVCQLLVSALYVFGLFLFVGR
ncbi:MAG TPA: SLC13 family permease [Thermodesulfovibrionales bacterium]|jgi:Na+/H+ antiporter NhaD/arsenite permease-like protein|nr:SLC13 family permease [Thermodesulfovibrionales bacterium]